MSQESTRCFYTPPITKICIFLGLLTFLVSRNSDSSLIIDERRRSTSPLCMIIKLKINVKLTTC